jgi:hypothetical protein
MQDNEKYNDNRNMFIRALLGIPPKRPKQTKKERKHNDNKKDTKQQIEKTLERPGRDTDKR